MSSTALRKHGSKGKQLTDKMRRFAMEYPIDYNGKEAAIRAGYPKRTAAVMACKLLKNPQVKAIVGKAQRDLVVQKGLEREAVLQKVAENLHRNIQDLVDGDGIVIDDIRKLPKEASSYIDGFEVTQQFDKDGNVTSQKIKIKLSPTAAVQDIAMKHIGGYAPVQQETTHRLNWEDLFDPPKDGDGAIIDVHPNLDD